MNKIMALLCGLLTAAIAPFGVAQESVSATDTAFRSLFNGNDLSEWKGDERFWSVRDGVIVGQTGKDNPAPHNTFLIYEGGEFGDFELRFEYKVDGFNSGVQYRSVEGDDFKVKGYQADFEARWHDAETSGGGIDKFTGMFFDEGGRMFMGQRGDVVIVKSVPEGKKKPLVEKIGSVGDPEQLEKAIRRDDWNEYTVIAKGFTFTHIVNGRVMAVGFDEDVENRRESGILAFQLHSGTPMKIQVKDVMIREL